MTKNLSRNVLFSCFELLLNTELELHIKGDSLDELDVLPVFQVPLWITCGVAFGGGGTTLGEGS